MLSAPVDDSFSVTAQRTLISRLFLVKSNVRFRSDPLPSLRLAPAIAPGRLDAPTFTVDPIEPFMVLVQELHLK